jgi:hypothetical protein
MVTFFMLISFEKHGYDGENEHPASDPGWCGPVTHLLGEHFPPAVFLSLGSRDIA